MQEFVIKTFDESADVKRRFAKDHAEKIVQVAKIMERAFREGRKVLLFGNGGSATDAAHMAAEFVGRYKRERAPLPAIALATDIAAITCIANDYGFEALFARQVLAHGQKGDIAIAISTSGNSPNVLKGIEAAKSLGMTTIAWTGGVGREARGTRGLCLRRAIDRDGADPGKSHHVSPRTVRTHRGPGPCQSGVSVPDHHPFPARWSGPLTPRASRPIHFGAAIARSSCPTLRKLGPAADPSAIFFSRFLTS